MRYFIFCYSINYIFFRKKREEIIPNFILILLINAIYYFFNKVCGQNGYRYNQHVSRHTVVSRQASVIIKIRIK